MSLSATIVVLALFAFALAPLAWILRPRMNAGWPAAVYGATIVGIIVLQTGILVPSSTANANVSNLVPQESARGRCQEVLALATDAGIVLDTSQANKLVVMNEGWQQLPPSVRDAVTDCAAQLSTGNSGEGSIEIITR